MPQTTYLPLYRASYPILAPAQKPGGVTVLAGITSSVNSAVVAAGGTGYAVGNTITLPNGVVLTVATLAVTAVATVTITNPGSVTTPPVNPVAQSSSSGAGTGATFNLTWAGDVPNKGSGPGSPTIQLADFQPGVEEQAAEETAEEVED
jgi:hypothetical protein